MANLSQAIVEAIERDMAAESREGTKLTADWARLLDFDSDPTVDVGTNVADLQTARALIQKALTAIRKAVLDTINTEVGN